MFEDFKAQHPFVKLAVALDLIESDEATKEDVVTAMFFRERLTEAYRSLTYRFEQAVIGWIERHGEIEDGGKRYYVGVDIDRKCRSVSLAFKALLESSGGDFDAVLSTLCSQPFKPAAAMKALGDEASRYFDTETKKDLATGKPRKRLKNTKAGDDE